MDALRRTFQHDAIIQVFDIRAEASRKWDALTGIFW
jgi:hypothetical protein